MRKQTCGWGKEFCDEWAVNPETKRYCLRHHAEYMRSWRKTHPLTPEQRKRDNARSMAGVYKRRGKLVPLPCQVCGTENNIEMHHADYDYPLVVDWLCRPCHMAGHMTHRET